MTTSRRVGDSLWSPLAHMPSVLGNRTVIVHGEGAYVTTQDGARLLDATSGLWHANVGHGRAEIADAAARQMKTLETYQSFGFFTNDVALSLADRLASLAPIDEPKVILTSGGSDSVEVAVKLARMHWQLAGRTDKTFVLSRADSYHGLHAFGSSLTGPDFYRDGYGPGTLVPDTARFSSTDAHDIARVIGEIGGNRIAAIITEPVIGSGGIIGPSDGYFEHLEQAARKHDILVIADEVVTGFGRTGSWFATERFGLHPEMTIIAKGVTSGYAPLGGVIISPRVWERFYSGSAAPIYRHGVTYSGHATSCAIAHANLDILEAESLISRAANLEVILVRELDRLRNRDDIREIRSGHGFLAGVAPIDDIPADEVARFARAHGVILRVLRENVIQISPPLIVNEQELTTIVDVIEVALQAHRS